MENRFCKLAVEALFPRFCFGCGSEGGFWCKTCAELWAPVPLEPVCSFCKKQGSNATCNNCRKETFLDGLSVYLPYGNPIVRKAISSWKYDCDRSIEPIIRSWIERDQDRMRPNMISFVVAPVPIHLTRFRSRGFDQADYLARWVSEMYGVSRNELLIRKKKTISQAQTSHTERMLGELDGIFSIKKEVQYIPESVLLCDDVFTSGATMDAAAKCLKEAGVKEVWGFVIAKGSVV